MEKKEIEERIVEIKTKLTKNPRDKKRLEEEQADLEKELLKIEEAEKKKVEEASFLDEIVPEDNTVCDGKVPEMVEKRGSLIEEKIKKLKERLAALERENSDLKIKIEEAIRENSNLQNKLDKASQTIENLQKETDDIDLSEKSDSKKEEEGLKRSKENREVIINKCVDLMRSGKSGEARDLCKNEKVSKEEAQKIKELFLGTK